jgi:type IV pilus assembly protein PilC
VSNQATIAPAEAQHTKPKRQLFSIGHTINTPVVMAFSRQLSSFLEAGIPLLDSLAIVGQQTASPPMRAVVADIAASIHRGASFVDAVDAHPSVFPAYYRAMLAAAEYTGNLDAVLAQLAAYMERDVAARRQVKGALTYPVFVLVVAIAAVIVMSLFVLPKFVGLYRNLGASLPWPTRMLIAFTDFMRADWVFVILAIVLLFAGAAATIGGARGKGRRDAFMMRLPLIGHLYHLVSLERFCRVLSSLATAGVPLPLAVGLSADSTNNSLFQKQMLDVRDTLVRGGGLYEPMAATGLFPIAARQMIEVGERTGMLAPQLAKAATYYEREVGFSMKKATDLFGPFVVVFVAFIVGFVAVAQIVAMYSIFGQVR